MAAERFLVTGAAGCIGAWTIALLLKEGTDVVAYDVSQADARLRLLLDDSEVERIERVQGDIRDRDGFVELVKDGAFTHIVHLAGLQVPFCKADPTLGSQVNVTGTVNVLEAARYSDGIVRGVTYASSVAVFGAADRYPGGVASDDSPLLPWTLYGAYKQANEATAAVYATDWGVGSMGLRPCIVYGPGRDQGLTSDPTKAMLRAAAGMDGEIAFGGSSTFHHAEDVAATFIEAARLETTSAPVHNVPGPTVEMSEMGSLIEAAAPQPISVAVGTEPLALPNEIDGSPLDTLLAGRVTHRSMDQGVRDSIEHFSRLLAAGRVKVPD